ncbi:uncharacterized protein LOC134098110 [Sardina pilchardus]|uniref:uncharacterized protein LOC134098110 n=1 Tax=Sardina pilchardus TaxID=27697 RepID=UPI002E106862
MLAPKDEADALATVDVDTYINQANHWSTTKPQKRGRCFSAKSQEGGTCYANATAAVLHLAMTRITGRVGGYPDFFEIREKLVAKYGKDGASTLSVVKEVCPQYRLQCEQVDEEGAKAAVAAMRPVIATFHLTDQEWDLFSEFYKDNPEGILTRSVIDIRERPPGAELSGHAVVMSRCSSERLRLMNSWGRGWGDQGFFRIQNADVLGLKFVDVFWTLDDLRQEEKDAYTKYGSAACPKICVTECIALRAPRVTRHAPFETKFCTFSPQK